MLKGKLRLLKCEGKDKTKHKEAVTDGDFLKMREHLTNNLDSPKGLQDKVLFDLMYFFGRRGREGLRELRKDSFKFSEDGDGKEYVTLDYNELDKNHSDISREAEETDKRMYAEAGPDCPVASLKTYLSKLNQNQICLFQRPNPFWRSSSRWYDTVPVGKTQLGGFLRRLSKESGCSGEYTNHCLRATTVTTLKHSGVSNSDICSVTGHKREDSLHPRHANVSYLTCFTQKRALQKLQQLLRVL